MTLNPPEAVAIATHYRVWATSQRTDAWLRLGAVLDGMVDRLGSWERVHQLCADWLPQIPWKHLEIAFADHKLRAYRAALSN